MKDTRIKKNSIAKDLAYMALSVALITVCAWITVPIGAVPVTLQTFAVALIGGLLGWKRALGAIFVYILMGLVGIPVFSNFNAGVTALFGATGGYIFGFLFLSLLPALAKAIPVKHHAARFAIFFAAMVVGEAACYFFGTVWFMQLAHYPLSVALAMCVLPFIVPDLIKFALASLFVIRLEKHIG